MLIIAQLHAPSANFGSNSSQDLIQHARVVGATGRLSILQLLLEPSAWQPLPGCVAFCEWSGIAPHAAILQKLCVLWRPFSDGATMQRGRPLWFFFIHCPRLGPENDLPGGQQDVVDAVHVLNSLKPVLNQLFEGLPLLRRLLQHDRSNIWPQSCRCWLCSGCSNSGHRSCWGHVVQTFNREEWEAPKGPGATTLIVRLCGAVSVRSQFEYTLSCRCCERCRCVCLIVKRCLGPEDHSIAANGERHPCQVQHVWGLANALSDVV